MIAIEFEQQRKAFSGGEPIRGLVRWSHLSAPPESVDIRLVWYTKGKGDRDLLIADQRTLPATQTDGSAAFEFTAPTQPYSFSGKLISLVWAVEAIVLPQRDSESVEIVIGPDADEVLILSRPEADGER